MSPNQRLLIAVVLSFIFFVAYTTIFPPDNQIMLEQNASAKTAASVAPQPSKSETPAAAQPQSVDVGHAVHSDEQSAKGSSSTLVTIESEHFTMQIDTLGRIASKVLKDEKFFNAEGKPSELVPSFGAKPLYIRFADDETNRAASNVAYRASATQLSLVEHESVGLTLTQVLPDVTVTKNLTFYRDGHYDVTVSLSDEKRYFVYLGQRPEVSEQMMTVRGAMIYQNEGLTTVFEDGDMEGRESFTDVMLASAFDQYFASIFYSLPSELSVFVERDRDDNPIVYLDAPRELTFNGFIGPKDHKLLQSIDPKLINAIEYGWFTFVAAPLFSVLQWLHGIFGNWGWAIVGLTVLIRIVLYPLTHKGLMSMQKIKEIAPKVKEVQAKYKGDPQRMNAAVMELYKKHGANPLGGCLPLVLQIPVFFAIYRVLLNAVELQGAPWMLWVNDLSRMDPTFVLPVLMGATMYYQQRITPSNFTDPLQEKIFRFLPLIFTFFFVTFPAGLVLYWLVNNLFSIAQQYLVNKQFEQAKAARHEQHLAEKKHGKD